MSGSPARTATAEDLFERRVPPPYHLADDADPLAAAACHAMAVRFFAHQLRHLATPKDIALLLAPEVVS